MFRRILVFSENNLHYTKTSRFKIIEVKTNANNGSTVYNVRQDKAATPKLYVGKQPAAKQFPKVHFLPHYQSKRASLIIRLSPRPQIAVAKTTHFAPIRKYNESA